MSRRDLPKNPLAGKYTVPRPGEKRPGNITCNHDFSSNRNLSLGARLAGGDLTKNSSMQERNQPLFATVPKRSSKAVDSLDLENFLQPK